MLEHSTAVIISYDSLLTLNLSCKLSSISFSLFFFSHSRSLSILSIDSLYKFQFETKCFIFLTFFSLLPFLLQFQSNPMSLFSPSHIPSHPHTHSHNLKRIRLCSSTGHFCLPLKLHCLLDFLARSPQSS